jgi:hypothetical protein
MYSVASATACLVSINKFFYVQVPYLVKFISDWESDYAKDDSLLTFWINRH